MTSLLAAAFGDGRARALPGAADRAESTRRASTTTARLRGFIVPPEAVVRERAGDP